MPAVSGTAVPIGYVETELRGTEVLVEKLKNSIDKHGLIVVFDFYLWDGSRSMKIFISWSGDRSEAFAKALREWFPLVLHFVEPWLSKSDIQAGDRWSLEVAKGLESCNFGVICVTRENLISPWILFEAGALAKSMQDGQVIPVLFDLDFKDISGPLAQFQAKKADKLGITELVMSLNKAHTSPVPEPQLEKLVSALWSDLDKQISSNSKSR